jgi:hypothetical protein
MTRDINEAFDTLLSWIRPSETETDRAASHRASIEACLRTKFGMTNFFRAGSFGHGTSVRGFSDIDYFAVIPADNLYSDSGLTLRSIKEVLAARFPRTEVYVHSPTVAVRFGTEDWERHEITPVYFEETAKHYNVYSMPDRYGGWMQSSPKGLNASINEQNDRLSKKAKQLVRLVKLWNYACDVGIRSVYLELRVAQYLSAEATVVYPIDVMGALRHIASKDLAGMQDPLGLGAIIHPCSAAAKPAALSKLNTALTRAEKAVAANSDGRLQDAFGWWDKVYAGDFPSYY